MRNLLMAAFAVFSLMTAISQKSPNNTCFSVLKYDAISEIVEKKHYVFTGTDTTGLNVKLSKINIIDAREEWVKRKDKNCVSPNPKECEKLVLETLPPVTMNMYTLEGPDVIDQYEIKTEKVRVISQKAGTKELPVLCPSNRTPKLISKLQESLKALGYPVEISGLLDDTTMAYITEFQKSKGLPYGDISLETLGALGVR